MSTDAASRPDESPNGRQPNGQLAKGNAGGPRNPFARRSAELRRLLQERITKEVLVSIVQAMVEKAKAGDVSAAKLLLSYGLGKPTPAPDPDRLHIEEFQQYRDEAGLVRQVPDMLDRRDTEPPLSYVCRERPAVTYVGLMDPVAEGPAPVTKR